jgi:hypothetical protein
VGTEARRHLLRPASELPGGETPPDDRSVNPPAPPQFGAPGPADPAYYPPPPPQYPFAPSSNGIGIAGGVCGIVAVVLCWIPFVDYVSVVLGVLAIIFGALGVRRANGESGNGKGLAITGIVTGIVAVVISVLFLAVIYAAVTSVSTTIGALPN